MKLYWCGRLLLHVAVGLQAKVREFRLGLLPRLNASAVTETVPEPETAVFRQNRREPKPRFFGAK